MTDTRKSHTDFGVTHDLFLEWRSPRDGQSNPTLMNNKVWAWLIRTRISAYEATQEMGGPSSGDAGPVWCFDRFGQSSTLMADGRQIHIAGEHEDSYDPDFCIYNDVVVEDRLGNVAIYGYPKEEFPPTDFHSATLAGTEIVIIGSLGYLEERAAVTRQIFVLDWGTFEIRRQETKGDFPGWIHGHNARLVPKAKSIHITGGKLDRGAGRTLIDNIDDWRLDLTTWTWTRLTRRNWSRWEIKRRDRQPNHLFEIRMYIWHVEANRKFGLLEINWEDSLSKLRDTLGHEPDPSSVKSLYTPDVPHISLPDVKKEHKTFRIMVDGVTIRYVEEMDGLQVTIEGELPGNIISRLVEDVRRKLSDLENAECDVEEIT